MAKSKRRKSGDKKHGRNAKKCASYRTGRYRTNKLGKLRIHLVDHPTDGCAITSLEKVKRMIL